MRASSGEPDFYRVAVDAFRTRDRLQTVGEHFLKILNRAHRLSVVARPGGQFAVAHGPKFPAERLLGDRDAEFLEDPLRQIDQPPAHHAVHRWDRTTLDHAGDGLALGIIELGWVTGDLPSTRPSGPRALKRSTQSRPPILAASVRVAPS
jgi:hypothetical protein